jgi:methionyl-tRNA formyltransferase
MSYRIVFFGTSEFAVPALDTLRKDGRFEIIGVVTQPDRPVGRHAVLTSPPVIVAASDTGLTTIFQPEKLKDETFSAWIKEVGPACDAFVVIAYGKILPQWLLDLPKQGIVNVHGSLLPRWRGPSPIHAAIAAGDKKTGVTIMKIDAEMDHGPVLALLEEPIRPADTTPSLHDRLSIIGASNLPNVLADYLDGKIKPVEQDHSQATICKILSRDNGRLDPTTKTAEELERLVRAYTPWPGTFIEENGKRIKILASRVVSEKSKEGFFLDCANGTILELTTVHPENGKQMSGVEYLRGHSS